MLRVCALLILGILEKKNNQVLDHLTLRHINMGKKDFNMRHGRLGRALVGENSLKIFLIHNFFETLTVYYLNKI